MQGFGPEKELGEKELYLWVPIKGGEVLKRLAAVSEVILKALRNMNMGS